MGGYRSSTVGVQAARILLPGGWTWQAPLPPRNFFFLSRARRLRVAAASMRQFTTPDVVRRLMRESAPS
jgi:hypothetical protein